MQEFVLSRRCLILTEDECFLYCGKGAYVPSLKGRLLQPRNTYSSSLLDHRLPFYKGGGLVHRRYARLVSLYACRDLSFRKDILRAFEGIARALTPFFGGFYWGLPLKDLRWALCWMHSRSITRRYEFPSWSWAGWDHSSVHVNGRAPDKKSILSFPDFNPDQFWPPCSVYYWTSPTAMEE